MPKRWAFFPATFLVISSVQIASQYSRYFISGVYDFNICSASMPYVMPAAIWRLRTSTGRQHCWRKSERTRTSASWRCWWKERTQRREMRGTTVLCIWRSRWIESHEFQSLCVLRHNVNSELWGFWIFSRLVIKISESSKPDRACTSKRIVYDQIIFITYFMFSILSIILYIYIYIFVNSEE